MKAKLNFTDEDDGVFWMSFEDFVLNYEDVYICRVFDEQTWSRSDQSGKWAGKTAGGCANNDSFTNNPQFFVNVSAPTTINIVLRRDQNNRGVRYFGTIIDSLNNSIYETKHVEVVM